MATRSISDAREHFADVISSVAYAKDRVSLTRNGKPVAAIIPIEDLRALEDLENRLDLEELRTAREEVQREGTIPWETVKKELGLRSGNGDVQR